MTLYAIVTTLNAGYDSDKKAAEEAGLKVGDRFTVRSVSMGQSHTTIYLNEFDRGFNSVFFDFEESGELINIYRDARYNPYL